MTVCLLIEDISEAGRNAVTKKNFLEKFSAASLITVSLPAGLKVPGFNYS